MTFSSILGQPRAVASLQSALRRGQLHHAYLFGGPEGVGKERTALALAQAANCERATDDACGQCNTCRRIADRNYPDVVWIMPEAEQIARGLAGRADFSGTPSRELRISQIRALQEQLVFRPLEARVKFVIFCQAEAMNPQAQNALLKTLEEPPDATTLVLVSSSANALLPTIRSRCLKLDFGPLPEADIEQKLIDERKLDPEMARLCAALSFGSLGAALALDVKALEKRRELLTSIAGLDAGGVSEALALAERLSTDRGSAESALALFETWFRDVALIATLGTSAADQPAEGIRIVHRDLLPLLEGAASALGAAEPLRRIDLCRGVRARLRFNASTRLQLEQLFLRFLRPDA